MEANRYLRGATNHLSRGKKLFAQGRQNPEYYFYSALELRFGIESRYREYLEHQKNVTAKRKQGWQIAALGRDVEQAFAGCVQEVNIKILSRGFPVLLCKYTPVTPCLSAIGEKLGNYLHAPKADDLRELHQWTDFEQTLSDGFALLEYSCSGNLLGIPMRALGSQQLTINMTVEDDQTAVVKALLKQGSEILMEVSYAEPLSL
ncbi:hypothetical protein [Pseudomonas syringae]|uniref:hypothetical protein n=1 Tax=Pseudomonas syringae TaxID=317 RepID=UPI0007EE4906|nr:hypothetical protein [Pseudomonas syringae]OBS35860.1 hypothetical protein A9K81_05565 [Pseudomonas syringae pv. syringae]